jgi:hypothetical protein
MRFVLLLLATACSDYSLQVAPPPEVEDPTDTDAPLPEPATPEPMPSPWGNLDPGSLPDEHFLVAWQDAENCCDDAEWDRTAEWERGWSWPPLRYDLVDLRGQVVSAFEPPEAGFSTPMAILPDGPGRFFVVGGNDGSTYSNFLRIGWRGDATTGQSETVIRMGWNIVELPMAGRTLTFDPDHSFDSAFLLPDPADEGRVYVLSARYDGSGGPRLGSLHSVPIYDPEGEVRTWDASVLLPADIVAGAQAAPWMAWFARIFLIDGRPVIVLGVDAWLLVPAQPGDEAAAEVEPGPNPEFRRILLAWSPDDGLLDARLDLGGTGLDMSVAFVPRADVLSGAETLGTAIWARDMVYGCAQPRFTVEDGVASRQVEGDPDLYCATAGPAFDGLGPTFLYWGTPSSDWSQRVVVSHGGQDVWTWDRIRVGLGERRFWLMGLERIEPVP